MVLIEPANAGSKQSTMAHHDKFDRNAASDRTSGAELAVVIPTFAEIDNIEPLLARLECALDGVVWEAVFVDDDSPDGTAAFIRRLAQTDRRIRCVHRIGRRGLSTAVIEGMLATSAPYLAVIDADMQHDETLLPRMLAVLKAEALDVVIASRYAASGGIGEWDRRRAALSGIATKLSRLIVSAELTDPMSGFFMITRPAFESTVRRLSGQGFKVLLDLFASSPAPFRFAELPYTFAERRHGESKFDANAGWEYLVLLLDKLTGGIVPIRFLLFSAVGAIGLGVHLAVLRAALLGLDFAIAQTIATVAAMTGNFIINNLVTYRDKRLRGTRFVTGLLSFYAVCSFGGLANIGIANAVFGGNYSWWVAGLAGAAAGAVWNYAVSSVVTWRRA
jgi:dolichol-phosphate mannosyltransferase